MHSSLNRRDAKMEFFSFRTHPYPVRLSAGRKRRRRVRNSKKTEFRTRPGEKQLKN